MESYADVQPLVFAEVPLVRTRRVFALTGGPSDFHGMVAALAQGCSCLGEPQSCEVDTGVEAPSLAAGPLCLHLR